MPQRTRRNIIVILLCAVLTLTMGCTGRGGGVIGGAAADSTDWSKEALAVYRPMEAHFFNGQLDSVDAAWPAVRDFCRKHQVWWVYYAAWERKAETYVWAGDFERAAADAEAMRQDAERRGNGYGQAMAYYVLAQGYAVQDNFDEAARYYQQAIDHYPADENPSMLANIYSTLSEALALKGDYAAMERIEPAWKRILDLKPVTPDDPQAFVWASWRHPYFANRFLRHFAANAYDEARRDLDSAAYYNRLDRDTLRNASVQHRYRSQLANALGRYDEALAEADSAIADGSGMQDAYMVGNLEHRARALEGLGRYREALADVRLMKAQGDSITQADNREQLNLLNKRFEVAELQLQAEQSRRHLIVAIAAIALLLVALAFYTVYTRHIRKKNRKLYEMIMEQTLPQPFPIGRGGDSQEADALGMQGVTSPPSQGGAGGGSGSVLFTSICRLMNDERLYTNADLNRDDVASRLATNGNYIADAIREATGGKTFMQFVNRYRLRHASQLLTATDDSIEQIAFSSGFNNRQTFARIFRDEFGMSPSDFRRASQES